MTDPGVADDTGDGGGSNSDGLPANPFEEQQRIFQLLSQDTRHLIIQMILGHPEHLMSSDELVYMVGKSKGAIRNQVAELMDAGLLDVYRVPESMDARGVPSKFYGFTDTGVRVLDQYNYLNGLPVARAVYEQTVKSEQVERHEAAPRPDLPDVVAHALTFDEPDLDSIPQDELTEEGVNNQKSVKSGHPLASIRSTSDVDVSVSTDDLFDEEGVADDGDEESAAENTNKNT